MSESQDVDILVWHYTSREALRGIIKEGSIRTAFHYEGLLQGVWFSSNQITERTARVKKPTIRIGVRKTDAPYNWEQYLTTSRMSLSYASGLAKGATPSDWFVAPNRVPIQKWAAVQEWDDQNKVWISIEIPNRSWFRRIIGRFFVK